MIVVEVAATFVTVTPESTGDESASAGRKIPAPTKIPAAKMTMGIKRY